MNKKVWKIVQERSEGYCEYPTDHGKCRGNDRVQQHHVFGKYNRNRLECPETIYNLCSYHHLNSTTGVHFNKANRLILEEAAKENLMNIGWSKEKIIREVYGDSRGVGATYIDKCINH